MSFPTIYDRVFQHTVLNTVIDKLLYNQFIENNEPNLLPQELPLEDLKKAVWLASILASSESEPHQAKVQLFTSLLYLREGENVDIERLCYLLMSRVGNLTATNLFKRSGKAGNANSDVRIYNYDALLSFELAAQQEIKRIELGMETLLVTRFQKMLWNDLNAKHRISISAPTSAGKSFIVKKYIKNVILNAKEVQWCLYIVPSRALINQVSEEFRIELGELANVYTTFLEPDLETNAVFVLTPERCLRLLKHASSVKFRFRLIFIDEIQNVEDEGGRGTLLEYIVSLLGITFPESQIVAAGPNLDNPFRLFNEIFRETSAIVKTTVSPVIQVRSVIRATDKKNISVQLLSNNSGIEKFSINIGYDLEKALNNNIGSGIAGLIGRFAKEEHTIIYAPKTNLAESWARHFAKTVKGEVFLDRRVLELIDYLGEEIHPKYHLIKCLKRGVAFHHGRLPEMVRKEVEDCFKDGKLSKLFCTSTLIEGVNLPARNLFIILPDKKDDNLTPFEFGNLIGRAGRLGESLYGTIYCIERAARYDWARQYFDGKFEKEVVPATSKALTTKFESVVENLAKTSVQIERKLELEKNAIILFRQKYLSDKEDFKDYIASKEVSIERGTLIVEGVELSLKEVQIPPSVCKDNPSIDPLLQDVLYRQIIEEGIESWVIHVNGNLATPISKIEVEGIPLRKRNLYWQWVVIMKKLDSIFEIKFEASRVHNVSRTIPQMCLYGVKWLAGEPYSQIIKSDIAWRAKNSSEDYPFDPDSEVDINRVINDLARINNVIVSHVLVKYMKLLNDILERLMTPQQHEEYKFSLALPGMLELGTTNGVVMKLIAAGVSRSVALKVNSLFEKEQGHEEIDVFEWLKQHTSLNLKPIYNRYLYKLKLLKRE